MLRGCLAQRSPGQLPLLPCGPARCSQGTGCRGGHRSARAPRAMLRGQESPAITSGDKAPYGDGEGRRLATARGRLRKGGWQGALLRLPGGGCMFSCSHLPGLTFSGGASRVSQRPAAARPCVPVLGGSEQQPVAPSHAPGNSMSWGWAPRAGDKGAQVTLPCLENMNLHIKVGVGPRPGCRAPQPQRQDHGAVQNGSREGAGARSSLCGASLGARSGGRQQVRSPGDVEIC